VNIDWYGADPCFWYPFEGDARVHLPERYTSSYSRDVLRYHVEDLEVPGDEQRHNITIEFWRVPPYPTLGLQPEDYPRIFTSVERRRKHVFDDSSLCVWQPLDPETRRWTSRLGLLILVEMVRRHLLLEMHWFLTEEWAIEDATH
jgi:hypothetical protein